MVVVETDDDIGPTVPPMEIFPPPIATGLKFGSVDPPTETALLNTDGPDFIWLALVIPEDTASSNDGI